MTYVDRIEELITKLEFGRGPGDAETSSLDSVRSFDSELKVALREILGVVEDALGDVAGGGGGGSVPFVGASAPSSPSDGELWWDTDDDTPVGGSISFTTLTLGPYTADATTFATAPELEVIDLGADVLGIIKSVSVHVTALDFDGGDPAAGFTVDLDFSGDQVTWDAQAPDSPVFTTTGTKVKYPNHLFHRYISFSWVWAGDQGPSAAATFTPTIVYT